MTDTNLKRCPFCGGKPYFENEGSDYGFYAVCSRCGCWTGALKTKDETLKLWNNRTIEDAQAAEIKRMREALELIAKEKFYFARGEEEKQIRRVCEIAEEALKWEEE